MEILLVSIPDAAKALSVGRTTVYELMPPQTQWQAI